MGTFFAQKLRSAVLYEMSQHSNDTSVASAAFEHYQKARNAWAVMAERAKRVYLANVSYGSIPKRSGHWLDRLPGIDADLAAVRAKVQPDKADTISRRLAGEAAEVSGTLQAAEMPKCSHTPP